jgi:hypothetical protein
MKMYVNYIAKRKTFQEHWSTEIPTEDSATFLDVCVNFLPVIVKETFEFLLWETERS